MCKSVCVTQTEEWSTSTNTIAQRVQDLRRKRGWSAAALAEECADLGMPALNRSVIANIESGRRPYVTTDELLTLAYALDVAPVHLLVPLEINETVDAHRYRATPDRFLSIPVAREWIRGRICPPGRDPRTYHSEVPRQEWEVPPLSTEQITKAGQAVEQRRQLEDQLIPRRAGKRNAQRTNRKDTKSDER